MQSTTSAGLRLPAPASRSYRRRTPEDTVLHRVVAKHLETFLACAKQDEGGGGLPGFVERELRSFLDCGILAKGFARVHCASCGKDSLVAFSCKKRGICPSCGGRRMADAAARLVDFVLPRVPVRQWVLSLPYPVRFLLAYRPELCRAARNAFLRAIFRSLEKRARQAGIADPRCGAVTFVQRFGGSLNLNVHFHALVLDGVFAKAGAEIRFHGLPSPSEAEIATLLSKIRVRILRLLRKRGFSLEGSRLESADVTAEEDRLLEACYAASVQGKIALGPKRGARVARLGEEKLRVAFPPSKKRCARLSGFSLHAALRVAARDRDRLERLCRYVARPPIANERLSEMPDGRILYKVKTPYADGTTFLLFDPLTFLEKLAALIPPPRIHLVLYHGVLAPNSRWRPQIVPEPSPARSRAPHRNLLWAELMRRVFEVDVLTCPWCAGPRRVIALIHDPPTVRKILDHLGLPSLAPPIFPPRPPPGPAEDSLTSEPF